MELTYRRVYDEDRIMPVSPEGAITRAYPVSGIEIMVTDEVGNQIVARLTRNQYYELVADMNTKLADG